MRMTNNLMYRTYMKNLNTNTKTLDDLNQKVSSQRRFLKISEDPAIALKAFKVRRDIARTELYRNNIDDIQSTLDEVESSISTVNDNVSDAAALILQGKNGTYSAADRKVVANSLRSYQEKILNAANSKFAGKYIFGGASVDKMPFTIVGGNLLYNGQNVNTGTFTEDYKYVDIGLGLDVNGFGEVAPESAINTAHSGAELLGTGVDINGVPNNLYNILGDLADMFENNNMTQIELYSEKLSDKADDVRLQYVSVGEQVKFVEFIDKRLDINELNNSKKSKSLEGIELEKAIIEFSSQELIYNACLQMGTKILQPSLLDYLR
ncbi:MAG: flgL [Clostridia bacterium]|nr:flgL [Clostridia bacterium]